MKKKLLSIALSAAMAVTCLGSSFFGATDKTNLFDENLTAEAAGEIGVCASSAEVICGEKTKIDFSVFGDIYVQSCILTVTYPEELILVGGFKDALTTDELVSNGNGTSSVASVFLGLNGLSTDFTSLTFEVPEYADYGTVYDISVSVSQFSDGDKIYDDAVGAGGTITVLNGCNYDSGIKYRIYDDYASVSGCDSNIETADILSEVEGKPVKAIEPHAFSGSSLTSVTIPESITNIGANAFYNTAWYNSQPDGLLYLDNWCLGYKNTLPETDVVLKKGTVGIADYSFDYCDITSIEFSDTMKYVGDFAFSSSSGLKSVTMNDGLESIGEYAFHACSGLTGLTIPDSTEINDYAFFACSRLKYVEIPDSFTSIGEKALGFSGSGEKMDNFVIYSTENSPAEDYALWYGFVFIDINKPASLSEMTFTLSPGTTQVLSVNNYAGEVEWYSADEDVATVNNGYVKAVSSGNTVIYAVAGDDTLECTVSVSNTPVTTAVTSSSPSVTTGTVPVTTKVSASDTAENDGAANTVPVTTTVSAAVTTAVTTTQIDFTEDSILIGDISGNGEIDLYDAIEIAKSLIGMRTFTDEEKKIADYNCDSVVDLYDAIGIAKKLLEK